ncbi:hypothetical protein SAMN04489712_10675 [Thermomonospora echinospora]|uniref:Uncharacterized protein n=1 Tax=Thermomonospora echinospora TaxID=1992 RepID=A0A1H6AX54_9ACTN|nr:hypothetical protein [Thermomonospora echinospora]SEG53138.1 hypothetical protein SAMN04489712_10675 [Thermomonospora echinospora]
MTRFEATVTESDDGPPVTRLVVGGGPGDGPPVTVTMAAAPPRYSAPARVTYRDFDEIADTVSGVVRRYFPPIRYAYQFLDETAERPYPILRLAAAPGVTLTVTGLPGAYLPQPGLPNLEIYRVQDPSLVPPQGTDILSDNLVHVVEVNAPRVVLEPPEDPDELPWDHARRLGRRPGVIPHDWFLIETMPTGTCVRHAASGQSVLMRPREATFPSSPEPGADGTEAFAYEFPADGQWGVADRPLLRIVATDATSVRESGPHYSDLRLLARTDVDPLLAQPWYEVWRVDSVLDVPVQGSDLTPQRHWRGPSQAARDQAVSEEVGRLTIDIALGAIPGLGDLIDIGEFCYALAYHRDRWGRPLSQFDIALMGTFALLPFVTASIVRRGRALLRRFGPRAERAVHTVRALENVNISAAERELLTEAQVLIRAGKALPTELEARLFELLRRVAPTPPNVESLLNDAGTGFVHQRLQELFQRYKKGGGPAKPADWARRVTRGEAREIFERILGADFARRGTGDVRLKNLVDIPRPKTLTDDVAIAHLRHIEAQPGKLWERLDGLEELLRDRPRQLGPAVLQAIKFVQAVPLGLFHIMKGNVGEILAFRKQLDVLAELVAHLPKEVRSSTVLLTGVRIRLADKAGRLSSRTVLFSDNIIATMGARDLTLRGLFEVKSGSDGVAEAAEQVFRWVEDRLTPGSQIVLPKGSAVVGVDGKVARLTREYVFTWAPSGALGPDERTISNLSKAKRYLVVPKDATGELPDALNIPGGRELIRMDQTSAELEYLTGQTITLVPPPNRAGGIPR